MLEVYDSMEQGSIVSQLLEDGYMEAVAIPTERRHSKRVCFCPN